MLLSLKIKLYTLHLKDQSLKTWLNYPHKFQANILYFSHVLFYSLKLINYFLEEDIEQNITIFLLEILFWRAEIDESPPDV